MQKSLWTNQRGAALAEVLIAILILVSGAVASLSLMDSILQLSVSSNNRIISVNIAREGIEAVRIIRDSNWLLYSGSQRDPGTARDHWNDGFDTDSIKRYRVFLARNFAGDLVWNIEGDGSQTDVPSEILADDYYRLYLDEISGTPGTFYTIDDALDPAAESTIFFRQIKISYIESHDNDPPDITPDVNDNMVFVESKVFWREGSAINQVELNTILSDWFGRDDHTT